MNESVSDRDDFRTAPATPGLLTIMFFNIFFVALYRLNTIKYYVYIYSFCPITYPPLWKPPSHPLVQQQSIVSHVIFFSTSLISYHQGKRHCFDVIV